MPTDLGWVAVAAVVLLAACGKLLGIEKAHVDPIFEDQTSSGVDSDDNDTTVVGVETDNNVDPDAAAESNPDSSSPPPEPPADECIPFDNTRVGRLNGDGSLTPLPTVGTEPN